MHTVLLPVDGSRHAREAALYLISFARLHGALEVHLLNVEPQPLAWQTHGMEDEAIRTRLAARADEILQPLARTLAAAEIPCHCHTRFGEAAETIVSLAGELGCDTIVMGTRGLGGLAALALGSVTRKVLHLSKLPVICIKADED